MTLRTATYDTATHKIVPIDPTDEMLRPLHINDDADLSEIRYCYKAAIAAAPEYKESE